MTLVDHLFAVIPMLGVLIFVHELGHFLVAKACGVRVLKFSIGFGAPIGFGRYRLRWQRGGTEYVVGWIPLGGLVRMLGETMPGDDGHAPAVPEDAIAEEFLEAKPVWQKLSIVFAGPVMNLLLPILCLVGILWVGLPRPSAVIGDVEAGSPAARAGIEVGDRVLAIDGQPVEWWDDVLLPIRERGGAGSVTLEIEREGERQRVDVALESQTELDRFGSVAEVGWIGLGHRRQPALLGVPEGSSLAAAAGLRSGDRVTEVAGVAVEDWVGLARAQQAASEGALARGEARVRWVIERERPLAERIELGGEERGGEPPPPVKHVFEVAAETTLEGLGLVPAAILVGMVDSDKSAARAGLQGGDLILEVDGVPIGSFERFASLVQTSGGRPLEITYSRDGEVAHARLSAEEHTVPGPYEIEGMEQKRYVVGIRTALSTLPGELGLLRVRNPLDSVPRAVEMSWQMTADFLVGVGKLVTGELGTDKLSGPIGIARIARKSLDRGWLEYLSMMMLISINLGILNLLPIPILDGGQAVIYAIEGIKRSPVSLRARELATQVGLVVLVMLMGRAFWNDLTPFWSQFIRWLSNEP
ncbi:MAG: RIP metalloprotease RseP [Deltaproteobacteria bacterium]|jgi:regulator of sigma E protease|nr:RIP metalloprotease RseP [Deltaproteobacteria bacterium]MBW2496473.1 RIP metalloprotease RseP [Deltaproteobacteria bacterium]